MITDCMEKQLSDIESSSTNKRSTFSRMAPFVAPVILVVSMGCATPQVRYSTKECKNMTKLLSNLPKNRGNTVPILNISDIVKKRCDDERKFERNSEMVEEERRRMNAECGPKPWNPHPSPSEDAWCGWDK